MDARYLRGRSCEPGHGVGHLAALPWISGVRRSTARQRAPLACLRRSALLIEAARSSSFSAFHGGAAAHAVAVPRDRSRAVAVRSDAILNDPKRGTCTCWESIGY